MPTTDNGGGPVPAHGNRDQISVLAAHLQALHESMQSHWQAERQSLVEQLTRAHEQLRAMDSVLDQAREQMRTSDMLLAEQLALAESRRIDLDAIRASTSWRVTAPLRGLATMLRRRKETQPAGALERFVARWQRGGPRATLETLGWRLQHRSAASIGAAAVSLPWNELRFYTVPDYRQSRVSFVIERLAHDADLEALRDALLAMVAWANRRNARLRLIAMRAPVDGRLLDRLLLQHDLELARDCVLSSAEMLGTEFDRAASEPIACATPQLWSCCRGSVPAERLFWLDCGHSPAGVKSFADSGTTVGVPVAPTTWQDLLHQRPTALDTVGTVTAGACA